MDPSDVEGVLTAAPDGNWMAELLQIVPEEFATWATKTAEGIMGEVDAWEMGVHEVYNQLAESLATPERKDWAAAINKQPAEIRGALFSLLDLKVIRPFAWRAVKPEHETFKAEEGSDE